MGVIGFTCTNFNALKFESGKALKCPKVSSSIYTGPHLHWVKNIVSFAYRNTQNYNK